MIRGQLGHQPRSITGRPSRPSVRPRCGHRPGSPRRNLPSREADRRATSSLPAAHAITAGRWSVSALKVAPTTSDPGVIRRRTSPTKRAPQPRDRKTPEARSDTSDRHARACAAEVGQRVRRTTPFAESSNALKRSRTRRSRDVPAAHAPSRVSRSERERLSRNARSAHGPNVSPLLDRERSVHAALVMAG